MKEKTRFYASVLMGLLMILGVVVAMILTWSSLESSLWMMVALVVVALFLVFIAKEAKRLKKGFPREDEMSIRAKYKAGYYTLWVMVYFTLGFAMVHDLAITRWGFAGLSAYDALITEMLVMMGLFVCFWFYFSRRGE